MISVPCLEVLIFWILLRPKNRNDLVNNTTKTGVVNEVFTIDSETTSNQPSDERIEAQRVKDRSSSEPVVQWVDLKDVEKDANDDSPKFVSVGDKLRYLPYLIRVYMLPLLFIYFAQYFINQGLVRETLFIH